MLLSNSINVIIVFFLSNPSCSPFLCLSFVIIVKSIFSLSAHFSFHSAHVSIEVLAHRSIRFLELKNQENQIPIKRKSPIIIIKTICFVVKDWILLDRLRPLGPHAFFPPGLPYSNNRPTRTAIRLAAKSILHLSIYCWRCRLPFVAHNCIRLQLSASARTAHQ